MLPVCLILVISGQEDHRAKLTALLSKSNLRSVCCATIADSKSLLAHEQFSAVISEDVLPDGDCRAVIGAIGGHAKKLPVIIVSRRDDWNSYMEAVGAGAFDYVAFPPNCGELERAVWAALSESKGSDRALAGSAA
jgi:two-component system, OmpR family, response regulator